MNESGKKLHLFDAFGIELEYMIVKKDDLSVLPVADRVISAECGSIQNDVDRGKIAWSNELALHVLEFKTARPSSTLDGLAELFGREVNRVNEILSPMGAMLMPTAMHPFMDPVKELELWPHDSKEIYEAFHRIFSCKGHGWANLQSMHINFPFCGDEEFGRLHAAIRVALPLIPSLAASSPVVEGKVNGVLDNRMTFYGTNSACVPSITGHVVPEPVFTEQEYREEILGRIYSDLAACDPQKTLQEEWVNARGAIARFERSTIEIRAIDVQECPGADLAVAAAVITLVKALCEERFSSWEEQKRADTLKLKSILYGNIKSGQNFIVTDREYLHLLGIEKERCTSKQVWQQLMEKLSTEQAVSPFMNTLERLIREGVLASRIVSRSSFAPARSSLETVYRSLCCSLEDNQIFS